MERKMYRERRGVGEIETEREREMRELVLDRGV